MAQVSITGKIVKINPTTTFKTGIKIRTFWIEESNCQFANAKYPNILQCEIFQPAKGGSPYFAKPEDLDPLKPGQIVRFIFEPRGNRWTNPKTREEKLFTALRLCSNITVLAYTAKVNYYQKRQKPQQNAISVQEDYNGAPDDDAITAPF